MTVGVVFLVLVPVLIVVALAALAVWLFRAAKEEPQEVEPEPTPFPEPWRQGPFALSAVCFPIPALLAIMDPNEDKKVRSDHSAERVQKIRDSYRVEGLKVPGELYVDEFSNVAIMDGHHRLHVLSTEGAKCMPMVVKHATRLTNWHAKLDVFMAECLECYQSNG